MLKPFIIDVRENILADLAERLERTRLTKGVGFKPLKALHGAVASALRSRPRPDDKCCC